MEKEHTLATLLPALPSPLIMTLVIIHPLNHLSLLYPCYRVFKQCPQSNFGNIEFCSFSSSTDSDHSHKHSLCCFVGCYRSCSRIFHASNFKSSSNVSSLNDCLVMWQHFSVNHTIHQSLDLQTLYLQIFKETNKIIRFLLTNLRKENSKL